MKAAPVEQSEMTIDEFRQMTLLSMEEICREIFRENQSSIKIKKEPVAVKNLVNIFNTMLVLSNEKGFQTMSLRDLSLASGLSMGALYSYFSSKDELLEMVQTQGRRIIRKILSQFTDPADSPPTRLRAAIRTHLYLTEVMQPWFYFSFMETKNLNKTQQKKSIEGELATEQGFIDILEDGNRTKDFVVAAPVLTASVIKAMLQDWYVKRWKHTRRGISVETYANFVIDVIESVVMSKK